MNYRAMAQAIRNERVELLRLAAQAGYRPAWQKLVLMAMGMKPNGLEDLQNDPTWTPLPEQLEVNRLKQRQWTRMDAGWTRLRTN